MLRIANVLFEIHRAVTEAMKMETSITAPISGNVGDILVKAGSRIESGDLLIVIE